MGLVCFGVKGLLPLRWFLGGSFRVRNLRDLYVLGLRAYCYYFGF